MIGSILVLALFQGKPSTVADCLPFAHKLETELRRLGTPVTKSSIQQAVKKLGAVADAWPSWRSVFRLDRSHKFIAVFALGSYDSVAMLVTGDGKSARVKPLMMVDDDTFLPSQGFEDGSKVVVAGLVGWMGNGPSAAAAVLTPKGRTYSMASQVSSDFEGDVTPFRFSGASAEWSSSGRTYPKYLNVSHAMANVAMQQSYRYVKGKLTMGKARQVPNAMGALDELAHAAAIGDWATVKRLTTTPALAQLIVGWKGALVDSHWGVPGSIGSTSNTQFDSEDLHRRFVFKRIDGRWTLASAFKLP